MTEAPESPGGAADSAGLVPQNWRLFLQFRGFHALSYWNEKIQICAMFAWNRNGPFSPEILVFRTFNDPDLCKNDSPDCWLGVRVSLHTWHPPLSLPTLSVCPRILSLMWQGKALPAHMPSLVRSCGPSFCPPAAPALCSDSYPVDAASQSASAVLSLLPGSHTFLPLPG